MEFEDFINEWRSETPYIEAHTSGSTGVPKRILLPKDFVRRSAERTNMFFSVGRESRLHSCVAADYIGGKMMAVRAEVAGCRFTWEHPTNRPLLSISAEDRIDLLAVVPSQMIHILDNLSALPYIAAIIVGGSAIEASLYEHICSSGLNVYESYGMTETSSHIALRKVSKESRWFEPMRGINVNLDDRGCLVIEFDTGEKFVTNDLSEVDPEGGFIIKGRADHVIITGGKKVNPFEVERRISHLLRDPFIITSEADLKWGSRIVLRVETGDNGGFDRAELIKEIKKVVKPHEVPKRIDIVARLPRTGNGKLIR